MDLTRCTLLKSASLAPAWLAAANMSSAAGAQDKREATPAHAWLKRRGRTYWYDQYALNEQDVAFARYDPDRSTEELVPVHDIEVTIKAPCPDPKVSCRGSQISTVVKGERLRVSVAKLDSYAAIVIEPSAR